MKKGEITAFLSLIFVLMVSFILSLTQSAWLQTSKNQKRLDVDRAVFSAFAEYQKELLEEYEVFALDGSYQSGEFSEDKILGRMAYYGSAGTEQEITEIQFLTDMKGQAFREQVLAAMEEKDGESFVKELTGMASEWESQEIEGEELSETLDGILQENGELLPEEAAGLVQAKAGGLMALALPKNFVLSQKRVTLSEQASVRSLNRGRGSFPARTAIGGLKERLLFEQYMAEHFHTAGESETEHNRNLDYELEYILCGKESDAENLKQVINRLLWFRLAGNYVYLMSAPEKQEEAGAMALTIAALLLQPEAEELIRQILLILWAFGESVIDIRTLLSGKRVPFRKDENSWQLQLSALFRLGTAEDNAEGQDKEDGLSYAQYLQILLLLEDASESTMRTIDRVEQNLRFEQGLEFFKADSCVIKLKLQNTANIRSGVTYSFPTYFGYM